MIIVVAECHKGIDKIPSMYAIDLEGLAPDDAFRIAVEKAMTCPSKTWVCEADGEEVCTPCCDLTGRVWPLVEMPTTISGAVSIYLP